MCSTLDAHSEVIVMERTRSGLLIPHGREGERWVHACAALAEAEGWHVAAVVRTWEELAHMLCGRLLDVGIVGRQAHLPPDRTPRLVIAEEHRPPPPPPLVPGQRRPWRL
jgi:hypothetical protein